MILELNRRFAVIRERKEEEQGFTLIELMIVVVIIGILAAIAIPVFANQQKSAIAAGVKSDVKNTSTILATALAKNPTTSDVAALVGASSGIAITDAQASTLKLPISDAATTLTITGSWDNSTVVGINCSAETTVTYTSTTGKIVSTDSPACDANGSTAAGNTPTEPTTAPVYTDIDRASIEKSVNDRMVILETHLNDSDVTNASNTSGGTLADGHAITIVGAVSYPGGMVGMPLYAVASAEVANTNVYECRTSAMGRVRDCNWLI